MKNANMSLVLLAGMASAAGTVNAQTLDETRGYAAELLADAEQRTSLLGAPTSAWRGDNFTIANADGTFLLNISGYNQTRYTINLREDEDAGPFTNDGFESGFSQPRTRLIFDGNVVNPDTFYRIELGFDGNSSQNGTGTVLDAYFGHRYASGLEVAAGQRKISLLRSYNQASNRSQLIEGSTLESVFAPGRSQGIFVVYEGEQGNWRYSGAFTDGAGTQNTDFNSPAEADWAASSRIDFAVQGDLAAFDDSVRLFPDAGDSATILGANFHIQQSANSPGAPQVTFIQWGGDIIFQAPEGWNIFAEFVGRYTDTSGGDTFNDFGVAVQGGFFLNDQTEIAAGWDCISPDDDRAADTEVFNTLQGNLNYWPFAGNRNVKFSGGVIIFVNNPSETGGLVTENTWLGLLGSSEDGQVAIQGQGQIEL